jgi:hypothetical protein
VISLVIHGLTGWITLLLILGSCVYAGYATAALCWEQRVWDAEDEAFYSRHPHLRDDSPAP